MIKLFSRGMTKLSRCLLAFGALLFATGVFGTDFKVDYVSSRNDIDYPITSGNTFHVVPGGDWNLNSRYFEIQAGATACLSLEGGKIAATMIVFRGENSTYIQKSGTANMSDKLMFDGGTAEISGGVCNASVDFRNCTSASLKMLGGTLVGTYMDGNSMSNSVLTFAACDAYAVTGSAESATYAITMTTPITKAPRSITVTGTPVSGRVYALVSGVADSTFHGTTTALPDGWSLVRRGDKLLLVESATLGIATATWTGLANDGNPRTPGNWECHDASGQVITDPDALPNSATTVSVPADATNFNFPKSQVVAVKELRFLGDTYTLNANADWSGLSSSFVSKYPATIDVNGHQLRLSDEPVSSAPQDFTVPEGVIYPFGYTWCTPGNNSMIDGITSDSYDRILFDFNSDHSKNGCWIDYDFGEGKAETVRGVRFFACNSTRRPKALAIYGTMDDPNPELNPPNWTPIASFSDLNLASDGWTEYLAFENETAYRGYRIQVTASTGGQYVEMRELELVGFVPTDTEVTSGAEGGELHFDVPAGVIAQNAKVALSGSLKVVKDGLGKLAFAKANQAFTGGVEVIQGWILMYQNPSQWPFGGYPSTDRHAMSITLNAGTALDVNGKTGWDYVTIYLEGGTISGGSGNFNPTIVVEADSAITVPTANTTLTMGTDAIAADLGGKKISISAASNNGRFILNQTVLSNGVIDVVSGGWFESATPMDARTVDLRINAAMVLNGAMSVHDYDALFNSRHNVGTAALNVYGAFTPCTDYFYGCTLQDGATIDLSAKTGEWSTTSQSQERNTVDFADGATIAVDLGERMVKSGERVIVWSERPAKSVTFKSVAKGNRFQVRDDGLYMWRPFAIIIR